MRPSSGGVNQRPSAENEDVADGAFEKPPVPVVDDGLGGALSAGLGQGREGGGHGQGLELGVVGAGVLRPQGDGPDAVIPTVFQVSRQGLHGHHQVTPRAAGGQGDAQAPRPVLQPVGGAELPDDAGQILIRKQGGQGRQTQFGGLAAQTLEVGGQVRGHTALHAQGGVDAGGNPAPRVGRPGPPGWRRAGSGH